MSILRDELVARPLAEWHEDMGPVLWWKFPISEAPYVGSPLDCGQPIVIGADRLNGEGYRESIGSVVGYIGGWPGYHTHWTPLIQPLVQSDMERT